MKFDPCIMILRVKRNGVLRLKKIIMNDDPKGWSEHLKQVNMIINFKVREKIDQQKLILDMNTPNVFIGEYIAVFEKIDVQKTKVTFTESATSLSVISKIVRFIFVKPEPLIDKYAADAMQEIEQRRYRSISIKSQHKKRLNCRFFYA